MSKSRLSNTLNIVVWTPDGSDVPEEVSKEITEVIEKIVKDNRLLQTVVNK